jgi:hypothetical protein
VTPDQVLQWLAVVGAVAGAVVAFLKASPERRRVGVEATGIAVGAQQKIIDDQQSVIKELRCDLTQQKLDHHAEIEELRRQADQDRAEIRAEVVELRDENERLMHRIHGLETRLA